MIFKKLSGKNRNERFSERHFHFSRQILHILQEYERAVIFRLGRLLSGGTKGPGVFFIIPCVDIYEKIDMRTATYEIPPQEVRFFLISQ